MSLYIQDQRHSKHGERRKLGRSLPQRQSHVPGQEASRLGPLQFPGLTRCLLGTWQSAAHAVGEVGSNCAGCTLHVLYKWNWAWRESVSTQGLATCTQNHCSPPTGLIATLYLKMQAPTRFVFRWRCESLSHWHGQWRWTTTMHWKAEA